MHSPIYSVVVVRLDLLCGYPANRPGLEETCNRMADVNYVLDKFQIVNTPGVPLSMALVVAVFRKKS